MRNEKENGNGTGEKTMTRKDIRFGRIPMERCAFDILLSGKKVGWVGKRGMSYHYKIGAGELDYEFTLRDAKAKAIELILS